MNIKTLTTVILATTTLTVGLAGLSHRALAKPYMHHYEHGEQGDAKQCQHGKHHAHQYSYNHAARYLKRMTRQLDLTEQQIAEVKNIFEQVHLEHKEKTDDQDHTQPQKLKALDPAAPDYLEQAQEIATLRAKKAEQKILMHAQIFAKVHAILTPEQQAKAAELRAKKAHKGAVHAQ